MPWNKGYDDGFEGRPCIIPADTPDDDHNYLDGYDMGARERRELKDEYSSNT